MAANSNIMQQLFTSCSPDIFPSHPAANVNPVMVPQPLAFHSQAYPTSAPLRFSSPLRQIKEITLTDVALHQAYKTVGMRIEDTRCFNCLQLKDQHHRLNWMDCPGQCPACPWDEQHWGSFCPRLCLLRKKEDFWLERADLRFAEGFDAPTPGCGAVGWKLAGLWMESTCRQLSLQSYSTQPYASLALPPSPRPSTSLLSVPSLTSSPATSVSSVRTPTTPSPKVACITSRGDSRKAQALPPSGPRFPTAYSKITDHNAVQPKETRPTFTSTSMLPKSNAKRQGRGARARARSRRSAKRTRSQSPPREHRHKSYRERSAPYKAPVSVPTPEERRMNLPEVPPSLVRLTSDIVSKVTKPHEDLTKSFNRSKNHSKERPFHKHRGRTLCERSTQGKFCGHASRDILHPRPSRFLSNSSRSLKSTASAPRNARKRIGKSAAVNHQQVLVPQRLARGSWPHSKTVRSKENGAKVPASVSKSPHFTREGSEDGEIIEVASQTTDSPEDDIMSALDRQLRGSIQVTEADWEDLFKAHF